MLTKFTLIVSEFLKFPLAYAESEFPYGITITFLLYFYMLFLRLVIIFLF